MHAVTSARLDDMLAALGDGVSTQDGESGTPQPVLAEATYRLAEQLTSDDDARP